MYKDDKNDRGYYENRTWFERTFEPKSGGNGSNQASDFHSPKPQKGKIGKKILLFMGILVISLGAGFGGGILASDYTGGSSPANTQQVIINPADEIGIGEAVAAKVIPSVVGISTTREQIRQSWGGIYTQEIPQGVGTGFIVDEKGYILTNSHVVSDGQAKTITVQLTDGREEYGTVLWSDATLDLAIVKIKAQDLIAAELGDSDTVKIGSYAAAIGNPLGMEFDRTVTQGGISGLNRTITVASGNGFQGVTMEGLIQTDAAINSGNSGGPLLNNKGQVIGINTAKASIGEGMGFAIPINVAKTIVEQVSKTGTFSKAYIGIRGADVENAAAYYRFLPKETLGVETGAYVVEITPNSPAAAGGLAEGDVIVALDGKRIKGINHLTKMLYDYKPGDKVKLTIVRDKVELDVEIELAG
ncbi:MAG: S1C family serine protease [Anaerovoracaceae bacterium]|jgi:serine protease Do